MTIGLQIGGTTGVAGWHHIPLTGQAAPDDSCPIPPEINALDANAYDVIYLPRSLERLALRMQVTPFLKQLRPALKPDGRLIITVLDLKLMFQLLRLPVLDTASRINLIGQIYGDQPDAQTHNRSAYSFDILELFLRDAGFSSWQRIGPPGLHPTLEAETLGGDQKHIFVEAKR